MSIGHNLEGVKWCDECKTYHPPPCQTEDRMRNCLLSCVEQALYNKSVEKRLGQLGTLTMLRRELQARGARRQVSLRSRRQVSLRSSLLVKSNAKKVRDKTTLKLRILGLFSRRHGDHCCC
jgi:hypothetical protein